MIKWLKRRFAKKHDLATTVSKRFETKIVEESRAGGQILKTIVSPQQSTVSRNSTNMVVDGGLKAKHIHANGQKIYSSTPASSSFHTQQGIHNDTLLAAALLISSHSDDTIHSSSHSDFSSSTCHRESSSSSSYSHSSSGYSSSYGESSSCSSDDSSSSYSSSD